LANCSVGGAAEAEPSLGASAMVKCQLVVVLWNIEENVYNPRGMSCVAVVVVMLVKQIVDG